MSKNYWLGRVDRPSDHKEDIMLVKSSFYNEAKTKEALIEFIRTSDRFSMGEKCLEFEANFAKKQGRKYAIFVSSGSMANLVLVQALINIGKLRIGDKIGFSALTWPTNVMPLIQLGLVPEPLDCSLKTLNVSPEILEKKIKDLDGLFLTNVLGFSDDIVAIKKLCEDNNVVVFEDNCESLGSEVGGIKLGNFGIASTFSFFVGHHISTIEGGMICTDDEALFEAMTMARAHGWDRNLKPKSQELLRNTHQVDEFYARYTFYDLAYNARPNEISGFLGNQQIKYFDEIIQIRQDNYRLFAAAVAQNDDFVSFELDHMDVISNFAMPIICKVPSIVDHYKQLFIQEGVEIRPVIAGNMTNQPFYKKYLPTAEKCLNSDIVHSNGFYFGNNAEMTKSDITRLTRLLRKVDA